MTIGKVGLWCGRVTAGLLLLFWGAFFVAHTAEWFKGDGSFPPTWVLRQHGFHLLMLVGLAVMLKWAKLGAVVLTLSTCAFFGSIGFRGFPWIALLNLIPLVCFGAYWAAERVTAQRVP